MGSTGVYLVSFAAPAIVALVSLPMMLGKVPPNGLYGFRTPKTLSSREIWYPANRQSGFYMFWCSLIALAINAILVLMRSFNEESLLIAATVSVMGCLTVAVVLSFIYLRRL